MSFQAMTWAITQDIPRTSEKFLLVMLANYADRGGYCYPSIERLAQELSQDRKTIVKSIKSLVSVGLLKDTGRRVGRTLSVVVYQLVGIPESSRFHYLYRLENPETGEYYFGTRSTNMLPHMDDYLGSGDWCREMKENGSFIHKEIIELFATPEDCRKAEGLVFKSLKADDGLCKNKQAHFYAKRAAIERDLSYERVDIEDASPYLRRSYKPKQAVPFLD